MNGNMSAAQSSGLECGHGGKAANERKQEIQFAKDTSDNSCSNFPNASQSQQFTVSALCTAPRPCSALHPYILTDTPINFSATQQ